MNCSCTTGMENSKRVVIRHDPHCQKHGTWVAPQQLEEKIRERIAYWENQFCNTAAFGGDVTGAMSVLMELSALISESWTDVGIFERDRARKILADMRRNITI